MATRINKLEVASIIFDHDETLANNGFKSNGNAFIWTVEAVRPSLVQECRILMQENADWRSWNRYEFFRRLLVQAGARTAASFKGPLEEDTDIAEFATCFSKIVIEKTIESGLYAGVAETLQELQRRNIKIYVVSGTTHADIVEITNKNGVSKFAHGIYGFGWMKNTDGKGLGKSDAYDAIFSQDKIPPQHRVVVGDSSSDQNLAKYIGCQFVGIPREHTNSWGPITDPVGIEQGDEMILIDSVTRLPELIA